jgi:pyrroline-5-carboxylate reductase
LESQNASPPAGSKPGVTVGVIGTGNMGSALVRGWARALGADARLLVWDKMPGAVQRVADCAGVVSVDSPAHLVAEAAYIIVVVKPKDGDELLRSIAPLLREGQVVVSSMAGVELEQIRHASGPIPALFRVMPNLGVEVGAGMIAVAAEPGVDAEVQNQVVDLFDALGSAVLVPESVLDTVTAVSGTGPALLALALEALEDGGVAAGLPRSSARTFARAAMLGAARTLVAGDGPAKELSRRPGFSSEVLLPGLEVLEARGLRQAFTEAVESASRRARDMRAPSSGNSSLQ